MSSLFTFPTFLSGSRLWIIPIIKLGDDSRVLLRKLCCIVTIMTNYEDAMKTSDTVLFEKYVPLTLLKGLCVCEGVGDRTKSATY